MQNINKYEQVEYSSEPLSNMLHTAAAFAITETFGLRAYIKLVEDAQAFYDPDGMTSFDQKLDWALHTSDVSLDQVQTYSI